jgi:two-component system, NarL family, response regulator LiaR
MRDSRPIRVMVVDDHPIVRRGVTFALTAFDDFEVTGEACSGEEALRNCSTNPPDVVLMDIVMPGMGGLAATRAISERHPGVKVVMLSSFAEPELVRTAVGAGAVGYLLKDMAIDELAQAIRNARMGQSTFSSDITRALISTPAQTELGLDELTDRQRDVLALVTQGLTNVEISERLYISLATVRYHVSNILSKLHAANRAEAAAIAVQQGLLI